MREWMNEWSLFLDKLYNFYEGENEKCIVFMHIYVMYKCFNVCSLILRQQLAYVMSKKGSVLAYS